MRRRGAAVAAGRLGGVGIGPAVMWALPLRPPAAPPGPRRSGRRGRRWSAAGRVFQPPPASAVGSACGPRDETGDSWGAGGKRDSPPQPVLMHATGLYVGRSRPCRQPAGDRPASGPAQEHPAARQANRSSPASSRAARAPCTPHLRAEWSHPQCAGSAPRPTAAAAAACRHSRAKAAARWPAVARASSMQRRPTRRHGPRRCRAGCWSAWCPPTTSSASSSCERRLGGFGGWRCCLLPLPHLTSSHIAPTLACRCA